jgi:hypothetical protein
VTTDKCARKKCGKALKSGGSPLGMMPEEPLFMSKTFTSEFAISTDLELGDCLVTYCCGLFLLLFPHKHIT